jgi:hypothetical protein
VNKGAKGVWLSKIWGEHFEGAEIIKAFDKLEDNDNLDPKPPRD